MLLSKHRKRSSTHDHDCHVHAGELNKHYPIWWIEELYRVWGGVHQWTYDRPTMSVGERLVYQISCSTPCSEPRRRRGGRDLERGRRGYRAAALHLCRARRPGGQRERIIRRVLPRAACKTLIQFHKANVSYRV